MKLLVSGDSWTFGSELRDPRIDFTNRNDWSRDNDSYRKSKIWPNKLAKMLGVDDKIDLVNLAWASGSNDKIVRQVVDWIMVNYISKNKSVNDLFVIVGFTREDRRDFYYDGPEKAYWKTIWPSTYHDYGDKDINEFIRIYCEKFYTPVDDLHRYINQVHYLELFFKKYNVNYLMFQSFHEKQRGKIEEWIDKSYDRQLGYEDDPRFKGLYEMDDKLIWREIDPIRFVDKDKRIHSFHNHIMRMGAQRKIENVFANVMRMHPNEIGHELWSEYLYEYIHKHNLIKKLI